MQRKFTFPEKWIFFFKYIDTVCVYKGKIHIFFEHHSSELTHVSRTHTLHFFFFSKVKKKISYHQDPVTIALAIDALDVAGSNLGFGRKQYSQRKKINCFSNVLISAIQVQNECRFKNKKSRDRWKFPF